jgi:hypothetical protein
MDDHASLIAALSLNDKVLLLTGADSWRTHGARALGLRPMVMSDGPAGARGVTLDERCPSSCLPCRSALGAGREVVQAYLAGPLDNPARPVRTLAAFGIAAAEPGESAEVRLRIPGRAFARGTRRSPAGSARLAQLPSRSAAHPATYAFHSLSGQHILWGTLLPRISLNPRLRRSPPTPGAG